MNLKLIVTNVLDFDLLSQQVEMGANSGHNAGLHELRAGVRVKPER